MAIISISIDDKLLQESDKLQKELGFSGRSEIIRAGMRVLISDHQEKGKLKGIVEGALFVVHPDKNSEDASNIRHKYEDVIKTHIHNQLENHKCLEIFVLKGSASKIIQLKDEFQSNRKIDFAKLVVS